MTLNEIRPEGFWVIGGSTAVARCISNYVTCRKLRGTAQKQRMADLPVDRVESAPPFTYCAVDYFGPCSARREEGDQEIWSYLHMHGIKSHTLGVLKHGGHSFIYQCPTSLHLPQRSNSTITKRPGNQLCWSQRRTQGCT